ncbi:MAG: hypothetical protein ACK417_11330 [Bacteroidia bacterium]
MFRNGAFTPQVCIPALVCVRISQRILFRTSKRVVEYLGKGAPYDHIQKVYSVHILYFDLGQDEDNVYHGLMHFTRIHKQDLLKLSKSQQEK